jgi:hypothetical protein
MRYDAAGVDIIQRPLNAFDDFEFARDIGLSRAWRHSCMAATDYQIQHCPKACGRRPFKLDWRGAFPDNTSHVP